MANEKYSLCFFCNKSVPVQGTYGVNGVEYRCDNCGNYILDNQVERILENECANKKHILAGYLYETKALRSYEGKTKDEKFNNCYISIDKFNRILADPIIPKTVSQKIDKVLIWLHKQTAEFGEQHTVSSIPPAVAYIKTNSGNLELKALITELRNLGYVKDTNNTSFCSLTSKGHERAEQFISTNIDSKRVFVAMQFSGSLLDGIRDNAIKPACAVYGFEAYTVDEEEHNEGIFDRIITGIRTSKFVIADLTYKNAGAYFEAGYAQGLGLEVIRCCNQEWFDENGVHFDLRHYNLIVWKDAEHLKKRLMDRIGSMFSDTRIMKG